MSSEETINKLRHVAQDYAKRSSAMFGSGEICTVWQMGLFRELASAKDMREYSQKIQAVVTRMGFSDFSFIRMSKKDETETHLKTFDNKIAEFYSDEQMWSHDLMLQYAACNTEPLMQTVVDDWVNSVDFDVETVTRNRKLQQYIKGLGFLEHYNIPLPATNARGNVLFTVSCHKKPATEVHALCDKHRDRLRVLARAIDYYGTLRFPTFFLDQDESRTIVVAPAPLQLLTMLAKDNVTLEQAAMLQGIPYRTAKYMIGRIKKALGVNTIGRGLVIAHRTGLI